MLRSHGVQSFHGGGTVEQERIEGPENVFSRVLIIGSGAGFIFIASRPWSDALVSTAKSLAPDNRGRPRVLISRPQRAWLLSLPALVVAN